MIRATAIALLVVALAGCRANVRDPACLAIYDDCVRGCESPVAAPDMPHPGDLPYYQDCSRACHVRARDCQGHADRGKKPGELE